MRKRYWVNNIDVNKGHEVELEVRKFLLKHSSIVDLTRHSWTELGFFTIKRYAKDDDEQFITVIERLKKYLKNISVNSIRYGVNQGGKLYQHYHFKLSKGMKNFFNKETLFWQMYPQQASSLFYGFEDPAFYIKKELLANIITHKHTIYLHLTEKERKELEKKGICFD